MAVARCLKRRPSARREGALLSPPQRQAPAEVAALRLALAPVEAAEEEVAEVPQPQ